MSVGISVLGTRIRPDTRLLGSPADQGSEHNGWLIEQKSREPGGLLHELNAARAEVPVDDTSDLVIDAAFVNRYLSAETREALTELTHIIAEDNDRPDQPTIEDAIDAAKELLASPDLAGERMYSELAKFMQAVETKLGLDSSLEEVDADIEVFMDTPAEEQADLVRELMLSQASPAAKKIAEDAVAAGDVELN